MIRRDELAPLGRIVKPHGVDGEMVMTTGLDIDPATLRCVVMDVDGIFVPFFIESSRTRGAESWLVRIDGVDNDTQALELRGREVYALTADMPEDAQPDDDEEGFYLDDVVGYTLVNQADGSTVGEITDYDDSTANTLLMVKAAGNGAMVYVPVAGELIDSVDTAEKRLVMVLPEGLM